jgi:anti-sigma28 factor (negative regulator of flagellin synthesis)
MIGGLIGGSAKGKADEAETEELARKIAAGEYSMDQAKADGMSEETYKELLEFGQGLEAADA